MSTRVGRCLGRSVGKSVVRSVGRSLTGSVRRSVESCDGRGLRLEMDRESEWIQCAVTCRRGGLLGPCNASPRFKGGPAGVRCCPCGYPLQSLWEPTAVPMGTRCSPFGNPLQFPAAPVSKPGVFIGPHTAHFQEHSLAKGEMHCFGEEALNMEQRKKGISHAVGQKPDAV